ncbi:MAG: hypothetical protein ACR2QW_12315 [bacterium]
MYWSKLRIIKMSRMLIFLMAMALSSLSQADDPSKEFLNSIFEEIQDACMLKSQADECFALIAKMRTDPDYQHPTVKSVISQSLMPIGSVHPQALDIAYEILSEQIENAPENHDLLGLRATIRYQQDRTAGLWEAKVNNVPGTFSILLRTYLIGGAIKKDIKYSAIAHFEMQIKNEENISFVLSSAKRAHEYIIEFGDESEADTFISYARDSIPWDAWRQGEWAGISSKTEFSPDQARSVIYTFCQKTMLRLDQGEYCADATDLINATATEELLSNSAFRTTARFMKDTVETVQPTNSGNSLQLLEKFTGDEHQTD